MDSSGGVYRSGSAKGFFRGPSSTDFQLCHPVATCVVEFSDCNRIILASKGQKTVSYPGRRQSVTDSLGMGMGVKWGWGRD